MVIWQMEFNLAIKGLMLAKPEIHLNSTSQGRQCAHYVTLRLVTIVAVQKQQCLLFVLLSCMSL
jgi:hypothetical protein